MLRIIFCAVLFLIMSNGLSLAENFKCTRPDGSVFFTNDPSQVPGGCVVEKVKDIPSAGIIPSPPLKQPLEPSPLLPSSLEPRPPAPRAESSVAPPTHADETKSFESFKSEAALLVEKFRSARHSVVTSSFAADQLKARRELADIKAQKKGLLSEIDQALLSSSEKRELERLLAPITE